MSHRLRFVVCASVAIAACAFIAFAPGSPDADESPRARDAGEFSPVALKVIGNPPRAGATNLPMRAGRFVPFACEVAFDGRVFFDPLFVAPLPDGSGRFVVVERRGTVQLVSRSKDGFVKTPLLDISSRVRLLPDEAEEGLLGLAFHPEFAGNDSPHRGEFFVYYVANGAAPDASTNRLSRFRMKSGRLDEVDHDSEAILIDQQQFDQAHNGGSLLFGPDGFLYLGLGDDGLGVPNRNAQKISRNLFSGILRIDVDRQGGRVSHPPPRAPDEGRAEGYYIPSDNPFVGVKDALEEFYAIGLRNPWRFSFDRKTGACYAADVGERRREEINLIERGGNYGWNYAEGTLLSLDVHTPGVPRPSPYIGVEKWPLFEYSRDAAHRCVIGGYVYRGRQFPELVGHYVYADQSGRIYALELSSDGRRAVANRLIAALSEAGIGISSFGEDGDGELYICAIGELASETGRVFRLRRTRDDERDTVPTDLADTGLFTDWRELVANPNLIPFDVNVPLWSDGAAKRRWIALPSDQRVTVDAEGRLHFPPGTVFVKHFDVPADGTHGSKPWPLETRVLVCDDLGGVYGATYRWSEDSRSSRLVDFNEAETIDVKPADGDAAAQTWTYPGRFECALCHSDASDKVLGFNLRQLDRIVDDGNGQSENQIARLVRLGVLDPAAKTASMTPIPPVGTIGRMAALDDESATLQQRVRSYLDANCSSCHNPRTRFAAFDARLVRDIGEQGLIGGTSHYHKDVGPDVRIVRPGDVEQSMLYYRMSTADPCLRMPPLGTSVVDQAAVDVTAAWIRSLAPAVEAVEAVEPAANTATTATNDTSRANTADERR